MSQFQEQMQKMKSSPGFIAALDQSGGSTPKALKQYGIKPDAYKDAEKKMFELVHEMRARIITSPAFTGERILGAILFERTMDGDIKGTPTADYLWNAKRVVPFLKVDLGLEKVEKDGVLLMKAMPDLDKLLERAKAKHIFGTNMRSVINQANDKGIRELVQQQFKYGVQILKAGLIPIIEPEVNIKCPDKAKAEEFLHSAIRKELDALPTDQRIMLKLTLPEKIDGYADLVAHPKVVRVVALSGGYTRDEANARLRRHSGVVASFSRALVEGLTFQQTDKEFNASLDASIQSIFDASTKKAAAA